MNDVVTQALNTVRDNLAAHTDLAAMVAGSRRGRDVIADNCDCLLLGPINPDGDEVVIAIQQNNASSFTFIVQVGMSQEGYFRGQAIHYIPFSGIDTLPNIPRVVADIAGRVQSGQRQFADQKEKARVVSAREDAREFVMQIFEEEADRFLNDAFAQIPGFLSTRGYPEFLNKFRELEESQARLCRDFIASVYPPERCREIAVHANYTNSQEMIRGFLKIVWDFKFRDVACRVRDDETNRWCKEIGKVRITGGINQKALAGTIRSEERGAHTEGWDDSRGNSQAMISDLIALVSLEKRPHLSNGHILLLGPGSHTHEVLALATLFPGARISVADIEFGNLATIKNLLDECEEIREGQITLYHTNFRALPFAAQAVDMVFANSVIDETLFIDEEIKQWMPELKRVLSATGFCLISGSSKFFTDADFSIISSETLGLNFAAFPPQSS